MAGDSHPARGCASFTSGAPSALKQSKDYHEAALTVFGPQGPVVNLAKDDITVDADGHIAAVQYLEYVRDAPVAAVILVDTSGSTTNVIPQERSFITSLVNQLNSADEVGLIAFSGRPFILESLTTDHEMVTRRLPLLHAYGQSAVYDSLVVAVDMATRGCYSQGVVVLVTDTLDNVSKESAGEVSRAARGKNVRIYVVTLGSVRPGRLSADRYETAGAEAVAAQLSDPSGGRSIVLPPDPDESAMGTAAQSIGGEVGGAYVLGFNGNPADLKVEVKNHPDYVVSVLNPVRNGDSSGSR